MRRSYKGLRLLLHQKTPTKKCRARETSPHRSSGAVHNAPKSSVKAAQDRLYNHLGYKRFAPRSRAAAKAPLSTPPVPGKYYDDPWLKFLNVVLTLQITADFYEDGSLSTRAFFTGSEVHLHHRQTPCQGRPGNCSVRDLCNVCNVRLQLSVQDSYSAYNIAAFSGVHVTELFCWSSSLPEEVHLLSLYQAPASQRKSRQWCGKRYKRQQQEKLSHCHTDAVGDTLTLASWCHL